MERAVAVVEVEIRNLRDAVQKLDRTVYVDPALVVQIVETRQQVQGLAETMQEVRAELASIQRLDWWFKAIVGFLGAALAVWKAISGGVL